MDVIFKQIAITHDLIIYYNKRKDVHKAWKIQNNMRGKITGEISFIAQFQDIKQCDFAVLGGWAVPNNLVLCFMLLITNKPFAFFSDVPEENRITPLKKIFKKIFFSFIPYLFVVGDSCKEHYRKHYNISEKKLITFPYGISMPDLNEVIMINNERRIVLVANNSINIFIANRFLERKGYNTLYEALLLLEKDHALSNFMITIAGQGELFTEYEKKFSMLSKTIKLVGWIEVSEYQSYIKYTDVYIHSSYFEPYGIPVIDAMAHGKLVIASDGVMSAIDNIVSGENGYIYSKYDSNQLYEILLKILFDRDSIYRMGKQALDIHKIFQINYSEIIDHVCGWHGVV